MNEQENASLMSWAKVEILGHGTHIGYVTSQPFGGTVLFRVDQPVIEECEETLTRAEWVGDVYAQPGSVVKRGAIPAATVLLGAASIYRITPCDEAAAREAIRLSVVRPVFMVKLNAPAQITASDVGRDQDPDYEDDYVDPLSILERF